MTTSNLGCKVVPPQQSNGEAHQTNDSSLDQERIRTSVVDDNVVDVVSDALPERPNTIPDKNK